MSATAPVLLADVTTLRLGGPAGRYTVAATEADLLTAVRSADESSQPVLLIAGGSNLVVADEGFAGLVVRVQTSGIQPDVTSAAESHTGSHTGSPTPGAPECGGVLVKVAAGENWDDFVARSVAEGWVGIEALSGIPGSVGATAIQNVGAYGQEVAQTIASVRTWDRVADAQKTFAAADCDFAYRMSRFKADPDRYLVLEVTFQLLTGTLGAPIAYSELARALGVSTGERALLGDVRAEVLRLRAGKGMVLDAADHDTWSAGSFFTNPILTLAQAEKLPPEAPRFAQGDAHVKTSAAWLIEQAGFAKGHGTDRVSLSTKHTLALTNRGDGSTADLLALAREIRDGVHARFGVQLVNEPVTVNCAL